MKILLVDDEIISIQGMLAGVDWCGACGMEPPLYALSVKEAKKVFKEQPVDMLLLDIEMPEENGIAFLEWVRERDEDIPCVFLTCHPEFRYAQEAIRLNSLDYVLKPVDYQVIEQAVCRMAEIVRKKRNLDQMYHYGEQWYQEQMKGLEDRQGQNVNGEQVISEILCYINSHLSDRMSVEELAGRVHLNSDYLNRLFKKYQGTSINKYIINERMQLAKKLLEDGGDKVSANMVALQVGYDNYANFVNMFKKVHGILPSQVKKS